MKIGFIGQGWIGKHYADDFERRRHAVVRYARRGEYAKNKKAISTCDIVFMAVPAPTTTHGFDDTVLREVIKLVGRGKSAVIKSTIVPGTTESIQKENPDIYVFHSPEFLAESTAAHDAAHPTRNIVGIPKDTTVYRKKAHEILSVLPDAPYEIILRARDAELVKYAGNCFLFTKVLYMNLLYDLVAEFEGNWEEVRDALIHDPRIGESHTNPLHASRPGMPKGRGAAGHCFIKDFEMFRRMYEKEVGDNRGTDLLRAMVEKNIELMVQSKKDVDLVEGVYGDIREYL